MNNFFVAVAVLIKRKTAMDLLPSFSDCFFLFFPGEAARHTSSITDLFISLLVLLLSWLVGIAAPVAIAILLTYTGHSLTWYCRPYLLLPLYATPSLFGAGFVHFLAKRSLASKVCLPVHVSQ